ncbi:MAG: YdeI/OmpD-associated family protein [Deltaproteobacteria bacterium]|nr:YdeI/OmpD-associated family protein [Deltaproteobacteria bacterium]
MVTETSAFHDLTNELRAILAKHPTLVEKWNALTDIQRNEWICWTSIAKQQATRERRIDRTVQDLRSGKKTPCCWPGCPHRRPSAAKWFK